MPELLAADPSQPVFNTKGENYADYLGIETDELEARIKALEEQIANVTSGMKPA
jgi:hypothetical protein